MSIIFTRGNEVDKDNDLAEGHGLTGSWIYVTTPIKPNAGAIQPGPMEAKGDFLMTNFSKLTPIYCDDPAEDDFETFKYIEKPSKNVVSGRAASVIFKKIEIKNNHGNAVSQTTPETEKVKHLSRLSIAQTELAISTGKTEEVVKKDVRAKVHAGTDFATTLTDLETDWSATFSDTDKVLIKHVYNAFKVIKYAMEVEGIAEAKKAALIAFDADGNNSDLDVLNYDSSLESLPEFPVLED
jgi:hypothetical protein